MYGIPTLLFPIVAMVSFVWILMKWEAWGTAKALPIVMAWIVVALGVAVIL